MKVRTDTKRQEILDVARRLFLENGFEATSMSEIARVLGGSKGTLYGYFSSKETLFMAAVETEGVRMLKGLVAASQQSSLSQGLRNLLMEIAVTFVRFWSSPESISVQRMVIAESARSEVGEVFWSQGPQQGLEELGKLFALGMKRGKLRECDPRVAALHLFGLLRSELDARSFMRKPPPLSPEEAEGIATRAVEAMLRGYGP